MADASFGGKAEGLSKLIRAGMRVPSGYVISPTAFDEHVARAGADADSIRSAPLEPGLRGQLVLPQGVAAVRSSATDEDGSESSFAGQHDTVLGVDSLDALETAVKQVWASALAPRAMAYRKHIGAPAPRMAVVVQAFIEPRAAGVVFTRAPTGEDALAIEAVRGRGDALVSGRVAPERFLVTLRGEGPAGGSLLSSSEIAQLAREARQLETTLGEPLDLEWAIANDGTLYWLQARPITTAISQDDPNLVWSNTNAGELLPDVATPMTLDLVQGIVKALLSAFAEGLDVDWDRTPIAGLVGGRIYFSMNAFQALARSVPGMGSRNPAELFGGHGAEIAAGLARVGASKQPIVRAAGLPLLKGIAKLAWRMLRQRDVNPGPDVEAILAQTRTLAAFDPAKATDAELAQQMARLTGGLGTTFHDVFAAIAVGIGCTNGVMQVAKKWLGDADGALASALLAGLGGIDSAESGLSLWRLGQTLRAAGLGEAIDRGDWPALAQELDSRPELRRAWDEWMREHGHHARAELDVAQARWSERPAFIVATLRGWRGASTSTPFEVFQRAVTRRERVEAEALGRLGPVRRRVFLALLERARRGTRLREQLKSQSVRRLAMTRATLLELGERARVRGVFERADDVFFVKQKQLGDLLRDAPGLKREVARARAELKKWSLLTPPPVVVGRLDPTTALPPPVPGAPVLSGLAVSAGVVEGIARVVLRADDDTHVAPGEILVAPFTDPGWAPYFVAAAGLVVDLGGALSHGSIIAREYGIPAVVNVGHGTRRIRSGSLIRVDGFRGEVTILNEPVETSR